MVQDKQEPTLSDKQTFKDQAIKNDLNAAASTAKCIFLKCLKNTRKFSNQLIQGLFSGKEQRRLKQWQSSHWQSSRMIPTIKQSEISWLPLEPLHYHDSDPNQLFLVISGIQGSQYTINPSHRFGKLRILRTAIARKRST